MDSWTFTPVQPSSDDETFFLDQLDFLEAPQNAWDAEAVLAMVSDTSAPLPVAVDDALVATELMEDSPSTSSSSVAADSPTPGSDTDASPHPSPSGHPRRRSSSGVEAATRALVEDEATSDDPDDEDSSSSGHHMRDSGDAGAEDDDDYIDTHRRRRGGGSTSTTLSASRTPPRAAGSRAGAEVVSTSTAVATARKRTRRRGGSDEGMAALGSSAAGSPLSESPSSPPTAPPPVDFTGRSMLTLSRDELLTLSSADLERFVDLIASRRALTSQENTDLKLYRRSIKNRESAQASRNRRKQHETELESQLADLRSQNMSLQARVSELTNLLRQSSASLLAGAVDTATAALASFAPSTSTPTLAPAIRARQPPHHPHPVAPSSVAAGLVLMVVLFSFGFMFTPSVLSSTFAPPMASGGFVYKRPAAPAPSSPLSNPNNGAATTAAQSSLSQQAPSPQPVFGTRQLFAFEPDAELPLSIEPSDCPAMPPKYDLTRPVLASNDSHFSEAESGMAESLSPSPFLSDVHSLIEVLSPLAISTLDTSSASAESLLSSVTAGDAGSVVTMQQMMTSLGDALRSASGPISVPSAGVAASSSQ